MTFLVTNLACFLLKIGSAPNFRPSFHFFNWQTAAIGTIASGATMFFVDGFYASGCVALLIIIFLLIHYTTPPKPWGDVSQSLIYHQVRKYVSAPFLFNGDINSKRLDTFYACAKNTSSFGDHRSFCLSMILADSTSSFSSVIR